MMDEPLDYPKANKPVEVVDLNVENGIKWGAIAQGLIFFSVTSVAGIGAYFGDRVITGLDKMNDTLIEVREEISLLNTGVKVNSVRIDHQGADISKNADDIRYLYSIRK